MSAREFDLILWGATGFTGGLVAEYLYQRCGAAGQLRWALGGRSEARLAAVRAELGVGAETLPLVVADSHDRASLEVMAARTRVVLTTVGPYALHGTELVGACIAEDTDYCDLCGEVPWMQRMLDTRGEAAAESRARLVHCCGFDSIPSDLGVHLLQRRAMETLGEPLPRVRMRVKAMKGALSGGTFASMLNLVEESRSDPRVASSMKNPYALNPPGQREGPAQPHVSKPARDAVLDTWMAPFVMASINTRVVHRSNALGGYLYGRDFRYDEAVLTGKGLSGRLKATAVTAGLGAFLAGAALTPTRALMNRFLLPDPGEGPSPEQREAGFFKLLFVGQSDGKKDAEPKLMLEVSGQRDPGYGATSRMISEAALALLESRKADQQGGFFTPATALGDGLVERLQTRAGMKFAFREP